MSRYRPGRSARRRRYRDVMKSWRRLRRGDFEQRVDLRVTRRRLLEEVRALELEHNDED